MWQKLIVDNGMEFNKVHNAGGLFAGYGGTVMKQDRDAEEELGTCKKRIAEQVSLGDDGASICIVFAVN